MRTRFFLFTQFRILKLHFIQTTKSKPMSGLVTGLLVSVLMKPIHQGDNVKSTAISSKEDSDTRLEECRLHCPVDEDAWLKCQGGCVVFTGTVFAGTRRRLGSNTYSCGDDDMHNGDEEAVPGLVQDGWIIESEETTKHRLLNGVKLATGVQCEQVTVDWTDETTGQRSCTCIGLYKKPCFIYYSDLVVHVKTSLENNHYTQDQLYGCRFSMEFSFLKRIA